MALKVSTALRNHMLGTGSMVNGLAGCELYIYSGSAPASADSAPTGTLLASITGPANASLEWATAANGAVSKSAQVWSTASAAADGTAGYFRIATTSTADGSGGTEKILQGSCGTAGADLNLSSTTITTGQSLTIDYFTITQPAG